MSSLVIITNHFPYGGEFISGEIEYLSKEFDEIMLVPLRFKGPRINLFPKNVFTDPSLALANMPDNSSRHLQVLGRSIRRLVYAIGAINQGWPGNSEIKRNGPLKKWLWQYIINISDSFAVLQWAKTQKQPDIAYTYWLGASAIALRHAWPNAIIVSRAHGYDIYPEQSGLSELPFHDLAILSYDKIFCVSRHGQHYLSSRYHSQKNKIYYARLGVDDVGGLAKPPNNKAIKIFSVSSVDVNKRVERIAQAVEYIAQHGINVSWVHAGDGPGMSRLLAYVRTMCANAHVSLLGQVPQEQIYDQLLNGRFNVFVNQSLSEGVPVSIMEAQSVGLATVATNTGGTPEVLCAEGNILHPVHESIAKLADHIIIASHYSADAAIRRRAVWAKLYNSNLNYRNFASALRREMHRPIP